MNSKAELLENLDIYSRWILKAYLMELNISLCIFHVILDTSLRSMFNFEFIIVNKKAAITLAFARINSR